MKRTILIEIEINPTDEAIESYEGDIECLMEAETESVLKELLYGTDGFNINNGETFETWAGTKVKVTNS